MLSFIWGTRVMKKQITFFLILASLLHSFSIAAFDEREKIALGAAVGTVVGGLGVFVLNHFQHEYAKNRSQCEEIKKKFAEIREKFHDDNEQQSVSGLQDQLKIMSHWNESCFNDYEKNDKNVQIILIKKKIEILQEKERIAQSSSTIATLIKKYDKELELKTISKELLERCAFENYGGFYSDPVNKYHEGINLDCNDLMKISVEGLSAEDKYKHQALQKLFTMKKIISAELHEKIQQEKSEALALKNAQQIHEKEVELYKEAIAMKERGKQILNKQACEVEKLIKHIEKNIEHHNNAFEYSMNSLHCYMQKINSINEIAHEQQKLIMLVNQIINQVYELHKQNSINEKNYKFIKQALDDIRQAVSFVYYDPSTPAPSAPPFDL